jgi:polyvinyl alcohol dehydrogenase (cytochrome)
MQRQSWPLALLLVLSASAQQALAQTADGASLFERHCAACHVGADIGRAPDRKALAERTPESILDALVSGVMAVQGGALTETDRRTLAEHLTGRTLGSDPRPTGQRCVSGTTLGDPSAGPRWNGWGATPTNSRFQAADQARLPADRVPSLRLKWAFGFPGASSARAQPAVAGGRLFVGSESGVVYALDARTGCTYWSFAAKAGVRTAMIVAPRATAAGTRSYAVYFGDVRANVYALDAGSGELLWTRKIDDHQHARITGAPAFDGQYLYVPVNAVGEEGAGSTDRYGCCTFRGSVVSLDAATGNVRWKTYTIDEAPTPRGKTPLGQVAMGPSGAGVWSAPTLDLKRRMLYVGTGNMFSGPDKPAGDAIIAMNLDFGTVKWVRQGTSGDISVGGCRDLNRERRRPNCPAHEVGPDVDFGSSPMLVTLPDGRDLVVAAQKSGVTWAFDPDNEGAVKWQYRAGRGGPMGGTEWGTATDGEYAYIPISDDQSAIYERPGDTPGGLHAVRLATGERAWFAPPPPPRCGSGRGCSAAQSAAITAIPGVVFSGSIDGVLRGFSTRDGSIVWEFDTNREFETVNGVSARGASIGGPGPVVVDGMLYVNSGYSLGGRPGNVLLAFEVAP